MTGAGCNHTCSNTAHNSLKEGELWCVLLRLRCGETPSKHLQLVKLRHRKAVKEREEQLLYCNCAAVTEQDIDVAVLIDTRHHVEEEVCEGRPEHGLHCISKVQAGLPAVGECSCSLQVLR